MELMSMMKKSFSGYMKWVVILAFVILSMLVLDYSRKYNTFDNMENGSADSSQIEEDEDSVSSPEVNIPKGDMDLSSRVNPSDLLPASNSASNGWEVLNSVGTTAGANPDLLEAGHHTGINTVGQSLRNANLQIRSDPSIPVKDTGPWNQTTIEATNLQVPFNLGQ
jgi:hypothetical protein